MADDFDSGTVRTAEPAANGSALGADVIRCVLAVTEELYAGGELREGLRRLGERLADVLAVDTVGVLLLDEVGRHLEFALALGYPPEIAEHWRFGLGQGVIGTVAATGEPLLVEDVRRDPRYIDAGEGIVTELAIPLQARGRILGVLTLGSRRLGGLGSRHLDVLRTLGRQIAAAIESVRLYDKTRRQARTLSLLHEVSRELSSILDRSRILERVAERLERMVGYDVLTLLLWDEDRQVLDPVVNLDREGREVEGLTPIPLGQGIVGTVAALRLPLRVPNVALDPRYAACSHGVAVRSELAVPLLFEGRLLGVLDLESTAYDAFDGDDEELVSTLASSVAIALQNARLYERVRASERLYEEDLATAREIQKRLLPQATAWVPGLQVGVGYAPARQLGGDFYDVVPLGPGRLAVSVGDVSGKGTPAALYGSLAVGTLREYALHNGAADPGRVLADLNGRLRGLDIPNRFVALGLAVYEVGPATGPGTVTIASAGLPYPWRVGPAGVHRVEVTGVPLGLLPDREYATAAVPLGPGESLVWATDGIEEALDERDRELGPERIERELRRLAGASAREIAQALLALAARHTGGSEPSDDRTVVVLKGAGSPGSPG